MNYREKSGFTALGGLLMLIGMLAAGLFSPLGAHDEGRDAEFGVITCQGIGVTGSDGKIAVMIGIDENGGVVGVFDSTGKIALGRVVNEFGGFIEVFDKTGKVNLLIPE